LDDIHYETADLDIKDTKFDLVAPMGVPMIKVDFPAIEYMRFDAIMDTNSWWLPNGRKVAVELNKFDINFMIDLYITEKRISKTPMLWCQYQVGRQLLLP